MLKHRFDPTLPLLVVLYLRMSSPGQRPRSPEQQRQTIEDTIRRLGYPWKVVAVYLDPALTGRLIHQRPEFRKMQADLLSGKVKADLILVDTYERLGRAEDIPFIRQRLRNRAGVLVLTADSQFSDPTSTAGNALAAVEQIRATEDGRIKAHNILRGKRDAVRLKHWPGGKAPFGFRLEPVMVERHGHQEVDYCLLVVDPAQAAVVRRVFEAAAGGLGSSRIARQLNAEPAVPNEYKPFIDQTINAWLNSEIYIGRLAWARFATGIRADRRIKEANSPEEVIVVPDFCEAIVPVDLWERVQTVREVRRRRAAEAHRRAAAGEGGVRVPGLTLTYLLTGLVRCGHCRRAMVCGSTGEYRTVDGQAKRYAYYACPGRSPGSCPNGRRIPEPWLRGVAVDVVRRRFFPSPYQSPTEPWTPADLVATPWFAELLDQVRAEFGRLVAAEPEDRAALERELAAAQERVRGWTMTLADPTLDPRVRAAVASDMAAEMDRVAEWDGRLAVRAAAVAGRDRVVDAGPVTDRLNRLAEVLAANNPTMGNLELALHFEGIHCYSDGRVVVRTCRLGCLPGAPDLLRVNPPTSGGQVARGRARPRRLPLRRVVETDALDDAAAAAAELATDLNRFAGLGPEWFAEDEFVVPGPTCWSREHAAEVGAARKQCRSEEELAVMFDVSVPTIRAALNFARESDAELAALPRKRARARWEDQHYPKVRALLDQKVPIREIAELFDKSASTILKAIALAKKAKELAQKPATDGNTGG
jgi:DNA invertase Pin-like site-specific DNA recombinase